MSSFYVAPVKPDEIFHYGMPERSGRYAWGSGDRPYQRLEGKVSKMENRLQKRLDKADRRTSKGQKIANIRYQRAIVKSNSILSSKQSKKKAFDSATKAQRKVNREEYRTSRYYQRYSKTFAKLNVTMDPSLQQRGLD